MLKNLLQSVFGPSSRYVVGDSVQPVLGDRELMVVTKVIVGKDLDPQVLCRWVDSKTEQSREVVFKENEIEPFDWYTPMNRNQQHAAQSAAVSRREDPKFDK